MNSFFVDRPMGLSEIFMHLAEDDSFLTLLDKVPVYFVCSDSFSASHSLCGRLDGLSKFQPGEKPKAGAISVRLPGGRAYGHQGYWHCAPMFSTPLFYGVAFTAAGLYVFVSKYDLRDPSVEAPTPEHEPFVSPIGLGAWADSNNRGKTAMEERLSLDGSRKGLSNLEIGRMDSVLRGFKKELLQRELDWGGVDNS